MKNTLFIKFILPAFAVGMLFFNSCKKGEDKIFDTDFTGIYFQKDSVYYSFGVTPLDVQTYELKVPVKIMGSAVSTDRTFSAEIMPDKTTAVAGVQYNLANTFVIKKDSVNGFISININRAALGTSDYKICFKLMEKNGFIPVNEQFKTVIAHFNNKVERPEWKDYWGDPTWPDYQLGSWNPLTYVKFIELFRAIEQKSPSTYKAMVNEFGPDLKNVTYGWPYDYGFTMIKYVLIPMYEYFMVEHPELGVVIPRPDGY